MKPRIVHDITEINRIIEDFSHKESVSNNYLLPAEIAFLVNAGRLSVCYAESNCYLFVAKAGGCSRLYYILNDMAEISAFEMDEPMMTEILFRGNVGVPEAQIEFFKTAGFKFNLQRDQYAAVITQIPDVEPNYVDSVKMADEAIALFNHTFDRYSGDFISKEETRKLLKDKNIIYISDNGELAGALHMTMAGKNAWISHLAVSPAYRRKGIASQLVDMYIASASARGAKRLMLWVQHQNEAAISLYERYGFAYTNKSTISLIKE